MKNYLIALITSAAFLYSCSDDNGFHPFNVEQAVDYRKAEVEKYTIFNSGETVIAGSSTGFANSYRIPSLVTAPDGKLIAVCEARWNAYIDASPTDVVMAVGSEDGTTWGDYVKLTNQTGTTAYMDPVAVSDMQAGKVFVFVTEHTNKGDAGEVRTSWMITVEKVNGTWQPVGSPIDIGAQINKTKVSKISGFGPGSGFQMTGAPYEGRLIAPIRLAKYDKTVNNIDKYVNDGNTALYSDDHGVTWTLGKLADSAGEFQIAESPKGQLVYNLRTKSQRWYGRSSDGGASWFKHGVYDNPMQLPAPANGCHGSVLGKDNLLYYSGPEGVALTADHDSRGRLILCRSFDAGDSWGGKAARVLLYDKAAGYSCMTFLKDGRLAVIAEVGDAEGFMYYADKNGARPRGWMRLEIFIIK